MKKLGVFICIVAVSLSAFSQASAEESRSKKRYVRSETEKLADDYRARREQGDTALQHAYQPCRDGGRCGYWATAMAATTAATTEVPRLDGLEVIGAVAISLPLDITTIVGVSTGTGESGMWRAATVRLTLRSSPIFAGPLNRGAAHRPRYD